MILSRMILPTEMAPNKKELYFRGEASAEDGLVLGAEGRVSFDTYFNGFFYGPYRKYTDASAIEFHATTSGTARLWLIGADRDGNERVLTEVVAGGDRTETVMVLPDLACLPDDGMVYLQMAALEEKVHLHMGWFESEVQRENDIRVAAVICTYKREAYVYRNLEHLQTAIWNDPKSPARDDLDVFVVDNGHTIEQEETEHICVFPNKNFGGSGGFTRGLIEAYRGEYSHVLFMDDDISFEPETLSRTIQFLKVAKQTERPICIGGQMLIQDQPTIQFESGASYIDGRLIANNRGLDLSDRSALLQNMQEAYIEYNAWWYCCFPVTMVDQIGLPLPLFIKTDDVEYGLRMKSNVVLINGIGVWHMAFQDKYSPHLEYYIKRNELVVSAIHDRGAGIWKSMWKMIRACGKAALIGNPQNIDFILWAYRDFLKGPDFFLGTDEEELNGELIQAKNRPVKHRIHSILTDPFKVLPVLMQLLMRYRRVRDSYITRRYEIISMGFWCRHLEITPVDQGEA